MRSRCFDNQNLTRKKSVSASPGLVNNHKPSIVSATTTEPATRIAYNSSYRHEPRTRGPASQGFHRDSIPGVEQCNCGQACHPYARGKGHREAQIPSQSARTQVG